MKLLFLSLLLSILSSFANAQSSNTTQGGHCYTLDIPNYMTKTFSLNDVATLQYQNVGKVAYVVVIEDSKEHLESLGLKYISAKDFLENFLKDYNSKASQRKVGNIIESTSLGNNVAQAEFTWKVDKTNFFMLTTAVETKSHFYKILTWTIAENKGVLQNDFLAISKSLRD